MLRLWHDLRRVPSAERGAILLSLGVGITLLGLKFAAYFVTGSAAIFSDALESIVNVLASAVALYSLAYAHRPPDEDHPYGHGKIEFVSAGFEGGLILAAAAIIVFTSVDTLLFHELRVEHLGVGATLVSIATIGNGVVGLLLVRLGRRQSSATLEADGYHLLADAVTSIAALAAIVGILLTGKYWLDPLFAALIGLYVGWHGLLLVRKSFGGLMDKQDAADERAISAILESHVRGDTQPAICGFHKLRHRHSGRYHWVDFHIQVPEALDVRQGHAIATAIENEIQQLLGEGNATAHVEPCRPAMCATCGHGGKSGEPSGPPAV